MIGSNVKQEMAAFKCYQRHDRRVASKVKKCPYSIRQQRYSQFYQKSDNMIFSLRYDAPIETCTIANYLFTFHSAQHHSVTTVSQDRYFSINTTEGNSHNSRSSRIVHNYHLTERSNVSRRPCLISYESDEILSRQFCGKYIPIVLQSQKSGECEVCGICFG